MPGRKRFGLGMVEAIQCLAEQKVFELTKQRPGRCRIVLRKDFAFSDAAKLFKAAIIPHDAGNYCHLFYLHHKKK
jgi:hypothetical protein